MDFLSQSEPTHLTDTGAKVFNDAVHDYIRIPGVVMQFVDTPQFQRLRDLKQLGTTSFVYPGGSHSRFEHSIGVSYLAGSMIDRFRRSQPELDIDDYMCDMVRLAGLTHDIGHGPFSHVFDGEIIPVIRPDLKHGQYSHELMGLKMLEHCIDENHIELEDHKRDLQLIKDLIMASDNGIPKHAQQDQAWMYEIVANGTNSVDVDKFDYIARDSRSCNVASSFDHRRLMTFSRVIDGHICYHAKEAMNLYSLFNTRYSLHKQVYTHRAGKAIEYMVRDALIEADSVWGGRLAKSVDDPQDFQLITDCVLKDIEVSKDPAMKKAQQIVHRIRTRRLYAFVDEYIVSNDEDIEPLMQLKAEDVYGHCQHSSSELRPDDIILHKLKLNWCNKNRDPLERVKFFKRLDDKHGATIDRSKIAMLLPSQFEERTIRVFSKKRDSYVMEAIQIAFRKCVRNRCSSAGLTPHPLSRLHSPMKQPPSQNQSLFDSVLAASGGGGGSTEFPVPVINTPLTSNSASQPTKTKAGGNACEETPDKKKNRRT